MNYSKLLIKPLLFSAIALCTGFMTVAAQAAVINIESRTEGSIDEALTGSITWALTDPQIAGLSADQYQFEITVTNIQEVDDPWDNSSITSIFLIADPTATFVSASANADGTGTTIWTQGSGNLPGFSGGPNATTFDFCLETDDNGQCGGSTTAGGPAEGQFSTFYLIVSTVADPNEDTTPSFTGGGLRWQGIGNGSDTNGSITGQCLSNCGGDPGDVELIPEVSAAGSLAALGTIFGLMAFMFERRGGPARRRRNVAA